MVYNISIPDYSTIFLFAVSLSVVINNDTKLIFIQY